LDPPALKETEGCWNPRAGSRRRSPQSRWPNRTPRT